MKLYLSASLLFFCLSCNHAIFVHKKDVIHNQKGYILFYYEKEEALFFPSKDTIDSEFLSQSHLSGYRIESGEKDLVYLKKLAINHTVVQNVLQNGQSIQVDEPIKLIPVNVQYYWGDGWRFRKLKQQQKVNVKYQYDNKDVELLYKLYDDIYIMSITPTRQSDKKRVGEDYTPSEQRN